MTSPNTSMAQSIMRNSVFTWFLAMAAANASPAVSGQLSRNAVSNLVRKGRFLEQNVDETVEAELVNYSVKLVGCNPDAIVPDYVNGGSQIGAAIFRFCPKNSCNDEGLNGCKEGYAELAVGLYTFVEEFMADKEDNMQWDDDNFKGEDFGQCSQYYPENDDGHSYYIGPTCTRDHKGVRFALFKDQGCYKEYNTISFEDISGGWSLPYSDGGLVSTYCNPCSDQDGDGGDNGNMKEMCMDLYDASAYKCEAEWEISHYYWDAVTEIYRYGQNSLGCKSVHKLRYGDEVKGPDWVDIIALSLLVLFSIGGGVVYVLWWKESAYDIVGIVGHKAPIKLSHFLFPLIFVNIQRKQVWNLSIQKTKEMSQSPMTRITMTRGKGANTH